MEVGRNTRVVDLNRFPEQITFAFMKLFLAVVVYLVIVLILGAGIFFLGYALLAGKVSWLPT